MSVVVAAFDVDETLTVRDCVLPFMRRVGGFWSLFGTSMRSLPVIARRDRDAIKALFVAAIFSNTQATEIDELGISFANRVVSNWMRQDVADRMRWHQEQGHVVVLVSASLAPYLMPLGDLLEVDAVLCTELQISDGVYTGIIKGRNCRGAEKAVRLRAWCTESGIDVSNIQFAYGDSSGDIELMALAANPVWVNKTTLLSVPQ